LVSIKLLHVSYLFLIIFVVSSLGKGSFFKAHKDTPRDDRMFGSLVVVFPTPHSGGELVFHHRGKEWTVDSAKDLLSQSVPSIAYAAFYSDVEHEVMPVKSGYRVTLTYNLYFGQPAGMMTNLPFTPSVQPNELAFKTALMELLADPTFLPKGGNLGFGLVYQYLINHESGMLAELIDSLKGSDAIIRRACKELSLDASLRVLYKTRRALVMLDKIGDFGEMEVESEITELREMGGKFIEIYREGDEEDGEEEETIGYGYGSFRLRVDEQVSWVTEMTELNRAKSTYIAYGNQATLAATYGDICLIVWVGAPDQRRI
jgi:hypothetical protein